MGKMQWFPNSIWKDQSCYIIGGGPSLKGFPWDVLRGRNVLGCNAALYLGANLVPFLIFGDARFLQQHRAGLDKYVEEGGTVISPSNRLSHFKPPSYVKNMRKVLNGLSTNALGWNGNTGTSAINLALLMGADPIYLLGFDMQLDSEGEKNFHNAYNDKPNAKTYKRFLGNMDKVARDLNDKFPGRHVVNLEDGTSALDVFPKENMSEHFSLAEVMV